MVLLIFQSLYNPPDKSVFRQVDSRDHMGDHAAGIAKVQVNNIHCLPHVPWGSHPSVTNSLHDAMAAHHLHQTEILLLKHFWAQKRDSELCPAELLESAAAQFVHSREQELVLITDWRNK